MKKQSRLAVLLAAVLAIATLFTGVAFATSIELNSDYSDYEAALSLLQVMTLADENVTLDLSCGDITINSSGFAAMASDGSVINGTSKNITVITSAATSNSITLSGSNLNCSLTLNNVQTSSQKGVKFEGTDSSCNVTILLSGENSIGQLFYVGDAKLKITSASGDGSTEGKLTVKATGWSAAIGGDDGVNSSFSGLTIAGGTIVATAENGSAIGGAGNDNAVVTIKGGHVVATNSGNSATIGGGGGQSGEGGGGTVIIEGGTVVATNNGAGVAIGGGTTDTSKKTTGVANIQLLGGNVTATAVDNYDYSSGYNTADKTYAVTTVKISKDVVYSGTINPNASIEREALIFDLSKANVMFDQNGYDGLDAAGNPVKGTHIESNYYIVRQSDLSATSNSIQFGDKSAISGTVHLEIDGVYSTALNSIDIPAASGIEKHVVLYLRGENRINNLRYFTDTGETSKKGDQSDSTLEITSADGRGSTAGSLLVYPPSLSEIGTGIYYNAGIGGTDNDSGVAGLTISGGTIKVKVDASHDCSAIGGGGNGYAQITITGGYVEAENASTGATIGGGVGYTAPGSGCDIIITGGTVIAKNNGKYKNDHNISAQVYGVAIGGGSSYKVEALGDEANVTIKGGNVTAIVEHGQTAIGAGNSCESNAGNATVMISGGTINCTGGIGGGSSVHAHGGDCTVNISGGNITVDNQAGTCIGGGTGKKSGGDATVTISAGTLKTGSIGGGLATGENAPIGTAQVTISGGQIQGQVVMAKGADIDCKFLMTGGTIDNSNSSKFYFIRDVGGAVYVENGTATMSGGTIKNCGSVHQASNKNGQFAYGGAFYVTGGDFIMTGGTLESNTAANSGGAVYLEDGQVMIGTKGCNGNTHPILQKNHAKYGGAIAVAGSEPVMYCGTMQQNTAEQNGGAVYVTGGSFTMHNGTISNNTATNDGGAVYMADGNFTMRHGAVNNNSAVDGGAVYMAGVAAQFTMESGTMNSNSASSDGGAIFAKGGALKIGVSGCNGSNTDAEGNIDSENGEDHRTMHKCTETTDAACSHPRIQNNSAAVAGGGIAIDETAEGQTAGSVYFYCGNAIDNEARYKGVGKNVFMEGGNFYLYDGANVGLTRDPDLVIIGGELHDERTDEAIKYLTVMYHADNTEAGATMTGRVEKELWFNLPEATYFFDEREDYVVVGWTGKGSEEDQTVRDKAHYVPSGDPVHAHDASDTKTKAAWDGASNDVMHLYAIWAPKESKITYVNGYIDANGFDQEYSVVNPASSPATYMYTTDTDAEPLSIYPVSRAGYQLVGWYIYQDEYDDQGNLLNANWGDGTSNNDLDYEPKYVSGTTAKSYANLDYSQLMYQTVNENGILLLDADDMRFGNITLFANFVPAYTDLTITKTGVDTELDENVSFIFRVEATDLKNTALSATDYVFNVVVKGNGTVQVDNLPVGTYKVSEESWSWRYSPEGGATKTVELSDPETASSVTFNNIRVKDKWLDDESSVVNFTSESEGND